jgi:hypothetical protein
MVYSMMRGGVAGAVMAGRSTANDDMRRVNGIPGQQDRYPA